jgi:hypothetical protein
MVLSLARLIVADEARGADVWPFMLVLPLFGMVPLVFIFISARMCAGHQALILAFLEREVGAIPHTDRFR